MSLLICGYCSGPLLPEADEEDIRKWVRKCTHCGRVAEDIDPPTPAGPAAEADGVKLIRCRCGGQTRVDTTVKARWGWLTLRCEDCGEEYERKVRATEMMQKTGERASVVQPAQPRTITNGTAPRWEVWDASQQSTGVTLTKNGHLTVSQGAMQQLGGPGDVELLFDRTRKWIGIRKAAGAHTYAMNQASENNRVAATIHCTLFARHYQIMPAKAVRLTPRMDGNTMILELSN